MAQQADFDLDTYTQLPLHMDPQTKAIQPLGNSSTSTQTLLDELSSLNSLHRALLALPSPHTPPPPLPINPKRTAQITKLRETANTAMRKSQHEEAITLYTYAIDMALSRPSWEPVGLVRDEASGLYANRAQAYMSAREWVKGWKDAECSVECKRGGNAKAWWRGGMCLLEMGRFSEAKGWLEKALEVEGREGESGRELMALLKAAEEGIKKE